MTLDEAIIYCEEVADRCAMTDGDLKCEREHRQLALWLKLLKRILDSGDCNDCALQNSQCRYAPRWGEQVRYNCPFYSKEYADGEYRKTGRHFDEVEKLLERMKAE